MFLSKDYVLASELVQAMGIHIANISMLHAKLENESNSTDIIKQGNCSFINSNSPYLPKNIREGLYLREWTDVHNMLPTSYVKKEFEINNDTLDNLIENNSFFLGKYKVADKEFVKFSDEFVDLMQGSIPYILNEKATLECSQDGDIDGYTKLKKNHFLTWYKV